MFETLPKPEAYRTTQQIGELQVKIEMTTQRVLNHIDTTQKKIDVLQNEIANRWKQTEGLTNADRNRIAQNETASRAREIINAALGFLDDELKHAYLLNQEIVGAKPFYPNKLQFLMNTTLAKPERERYCTVIAAAGPVELMGYATHAIATQDAALGAAVIQANDAQPSKDRRFLSADIVSLMTIAAWDTLQKAFVYSDSQFQQCVIAIRVFKAAKPSGVSTLHLATLKGKTSLNADGSMRMQGLSDDQ